MKEVYNVEIYCENSELHKSYKYTVDCASLHEVARTILTFKPKRGYHLVEIFSSLTTRLV